MITISKLFDKDNQLIGFRCSGHAGYAESGNDIVCSAVSILVINTVNSIETFTDDDISYSSNEDTGEILFRFNSKPSSDSLLLIKSLFLGLDGIKQEYGKFILII